MLVIERIPFIENWFFFGFLVQVTLLGIVHYRIEGAWTTVFLNSGRPSVLRPRQSFDATSMFILLLNTFVSVSFFLAKFLMGDFYIKSAFTVAALIAAAILVVWHFDYFFLWFFTQKASFKAIYEGNVWLCLLGMMVVGLNFIQFFFSASRFIFVVLIALSLFVFVLRLWALATVTKNIGLLWYYFILYFYTVYVIPSVLISKYYDSQWLELLTP